MPDQARHRLRIGATAVELLEAARSPVPEDALLSLLRERRGVSDGAWHQAKFRDPFLLLDDGRIGLRGRYVARADGAAR